MWCLYLQWVCSFIHTYVDNIGNKLVCHNTAAIVLFFRVWFFNIFFYGFCDCVYQAPFDGTFIITLCTNMLVYVCICTIYDDDDVEKKVIVSCSQQINIQNKISELQTCGVFQEKPLFPCEKKFARSDQRNFRSRSCQNLNLHGSMHLNTGMCIHVHTYVKPTKAQIIKCWWTDITQNIIKVKWVRTNHTYKLRITITMQEMQVSFILTATPRSGSLHSCVHLSYLIIF